MREIYLTAARLLADASSLIRSRQRYADISDTVPGPDQRTEGRKCSCCSLK